MVKKTGINGISRAAIDNMNAETERIAATVDYIAMMAEIDIPIEESEVTDNGEI